MSLTRAAYSSNFVTGTSFSSTLKYLGTDARYITEGTSKYNTKFSMYFELHVL